MTSSKVEVSRLSPADWEVLQDLRLRALKEAPDAPVCGGSSSWSSFRRGPAPSRSASPHYSRNGDSRVRSQRDRLQGAQQFHLDLLRRLPHHVHGQDTFDESGTPGDVVQELPG